MVGSLGTCLGTALGFVGWGGRVLLPGGGPHLGTSGFLGGGSYPPATCVVFLGGGFWVSPNAPPPLEAKLARPCAKTSLVHGRDARRPDASKIHQESTPLSHHAPHLGRNPLLINCPGATSPPGVGPLPLVSPPSPAFLLRERLASPHPLFHQPE